MSEHTTPIPADEAREAALDKYLACEHDINHPDYKRPMSVCDVCRGRFSCESFEDGFDAGLAAARTAPEPSNACDDCGFTLSYPLEQEPTCYRCDSQEWESMYRKLLERRAPEEVKEAMEAVERLARAYEAHPPTSEASVEIGQSLRTLLDHVSHSPAAREAEAVEGEK